MQPDICKISRKLQFFWLRTSVIAEVNSTMQKNVAWFVKHNAAFAHQAQVDSVYLAYLRNFKD